MSQTLPTTLEIREVVDETPTIKTFFFDTPFEFQPGQFVMVWLPDVDEKPIGIWRTNDERFGLTVAAVGPWSQKIHELKAGDKLGIRGPFGRPFSVLENKKVVLVGGGFGTAPLLTLATAAKRNGCEVTTIIGARSAENIFGEKYAAEVSDEVLLATDDGSAGHHGFTTEVLEKVLAEKDVDLVATCGPEMMMKKIAEICVAKNVRSELSLERFMKCGVGICGACVMDDSAFCVCSEGPMIDGETALCLVEFGSHHRDSVGDIVK